MQMRVMKMGLYEVDHSCTLQNMPQELQRAKRSILYGPCDCRRISSKYFFDEMDVKEVSIQMASQVP